MKNKLVALCLTPLLAICMIPSIGCTSQNTLAALVTTLGNASAAVASLEGNTILAAQLGADTAAAANAVLNWKSGTPAQDVIQALNVVESDLNMLPYVGGYTALIDLGIATVDSIISIVSSESAESFSDDKASNTVKGVAPHRQVYTGKVPKNSDTFKSDWNKIVDSDHTLTPARIN